MKHKDNNKKIFKSIGELWGNFKWPHICEISFQQRKGLKKYEELMVQNFPSWQKQ